jgi:Tol biopolymer transport system component/DNA-binding winged helix-turn-helix (wHTH) protein
MSHVFGDFELDQERRQLLRSGTPVPLEPKTYELLCLLLARRPRALSRAQIRDVVWPDTFISESTLGVAVNSLRQALGDDAHEPRFIRTVRGFGYAFCGDARETSRAQDPVPPVEAPVSQAGASVARRSGRPAAPRRFMLWSALGAAAVAVAVGGWLLSKRTADAPARPFTITPFTTDGGFKEWPQLSPDGERVVYSWAGPGGENWDIYVNAVGIRTRPMRLTEHAANDWSPVWSPDGRQIAFVRDFASSAALYTVPALGGQERKLTDLSGPVSMGYFLAALSWSPDGRWLAFAEKPLEGQPARIVRLSLDTLEKQPLTSPPDASFGDFFPSVSPDGKFLAFVRSGAGEDTAGNLDVWVQPVGAGRARRLTSGSYDFCRGLGWTPAGDEIVFTAGGFFTERIHRVRLEGGGAQPVAGVGANTGSPSVRANRMVYLQMTDSRWEIWSLPGRTSGRTRVPEKLIASSQSEINPAYSPDGRKIAFDSYRSGSDNVWICDADGSHPVQLTSFESYAGSPHWSPDGKRIVFDSIEAGDWNLYVSEVEGGLPRRLTQESYQDYAGAWSRDGQWIYFASDRGPRRQIWKIPSAGGQAVQVTQGGATYAQETWDGRSLYFVNLNDSIWRVPVAGGEESEVVRGPLAYNRDWALSSRGLYYAIERARVYGGVDDHFRSRVPTEYAIWFLDFESGKVTELFRKDGPFRHRWLAVSPDEERILYGEQALAQSEIMLVENFR